MNTANIEVTWGFGALDRRSDPDLDVAGDHRFVTLHARTNRSKRSNPFSHSTWSSSGLAIPFRHPGSNARTEDLS